MKRDSRYCAAIAGFSARMARSARKQFRNPPPASIHRQSSCFPHQQQSDSAPASKTRTPDGELLSPWFENRTPFTQKMTKRIRPDQINTRIRKSNRQRPPEMAARSRFLLANDNDPVLVCRGGRMTFRGHAKEIKDNRYN
jgi:hypothetical protein